MLAHQVRIQTNQGDGLYQSGHINFNACHSLHFSWDVIEGWIINKKNQKVTMTSNCSMIMSHFEEALATHLLQLLPQSFDGFTGIERTDIIAQKAYA